LNRAGCFGICICCAKPRAKGEAIRTTQATRPTVRSLGALLLLCLATVLLIPLESFFAGGVVWAASALLVVTNPDSRVRRNLSLVLAAIAVLSVAPIHTGREIRHFFTLGLPFFVVVVGPYVFMKWRAPGEVEWRLLPRRFSWVDLLYALLSIPLSWSVIELYFFHLNPELPTHWPMPVPFDAGAVRRLVIGINGVGIWDELFFVNTVYALLRKVFRARIANLAQAVVYTSVLYDMAFTGWGIAIVCLFALTQGTMFERSRVLLYVLIVHVVVDIFLIMAILQYHYPDHTLLLF
jgi:hypothetical protein